MSADGKTPRVRDGHDGPERQPLTRSHKHPPHRAADPAASPEPAAPGNQALQRFLSKARVSEPGDAREREADQIASGKKRPPPTTGSAPADSALRDALGGGHPIEPGLRGFMEGRGDLRDVRLHTSPSASAAADSLEARAFAADRDIVFGSHAPSPDSPDGRRLLAHEIAHLAQPSHAAPGEHTIQRAPTNSPCPDPDPAAATPQFVPLPVIGGVTVTDTPNGAVLKYSDFGKITIDIAPDGPPRHKAFAYNVFPRTLHRQYDIIRVVAAPGVKISTVGLYQAMPSWQNPLVEIFRVQDAELVPGAGQPITPSAITGIKPVPRDPTDTRLILFPHEVIVNKVEDGVDIILAKSRKAVRIRAPRGAANAKFAYTVTPGGEKPISLPGDDGNRVPMHEPTIVTVTKTPAVTVTLLSGTRGWVPEISTRVYDVDRLNQVPEQGTPLKETGREVKPFAGEIDETLEEAIARASLDIGVGLIPIVGDLVDIAEFAYALKTDRDRWGRKVSTEEKALMGIGAVLPIVGAGMLRGASRVGRKAIAEVAEATARNTDEAARIVHGIESLSEAELQNVRRWDDLLRRGDRIPEGELDAARAILTKIGRAVPGESGALTGLALRDMVNESGSGFRIPELQEAYRKALAEAESQGAKQPSPQEWLRSTQGRERLLVETTLGPEATAIEFAANVDDYVAAMRREVAAGGTAARSWDWNRFPELPKGTKWEPGDPINMPDINGNYPTYNMARKRYWMSRANAEKNARAGGAAQDATSQDPISRLSDSDLDGIFKKGNSPPDPFDPTRVVELEHVGVPQRVAEWIGDLGPSYQRTGMQLAEVSDPARLLEVTPFEHAFHDTFAHTSRIPGRPAVVNPKRADITGWTWRHTALGDARDVRPLERMSDETLRELIARTAFANFNQTPKTQALKAAINDEILLRKLGVQLIP
jgi:hypothetical protein